MTYDTRYVMSDVIDIVVIGAGPTGVEMAGAIVDLAKSSLQGQFRSIATDDARVLLIEGEENQCVSINLAGKMH